MAIVPMLLLGILAGCGSNSKGDTGPKTEKNGTKTITIGLDPYSYSTMPAYLSKEILEKEGYKVKIKNSQAGVLFSALSSGKLDAYIDLWPNLQKQYFDRYKGEFKIAGTLYKHAPIGMAVPKYMQDVNKIPDLKKYHDKFKGKIYGIEPETGTDQTTKKMIKAYHMDYKVVNSSEQGMLGEAKRKISNHEPVVFQGWEPHTMFKKLPIKMLKDPKHIFQFDDVKVGVKSDLKKQEPEAYTLLANMHFSINEVEDWLVQMKDHDKKPKQLAKQWVKDHKKRVKMWKKTTEGR